MRPSDWFELEGDNLLWAPAPVAAETVIELILENRLHHPHQSHEVVVPRLMTFLWRKNTVKEADLLFTVPVGNYFWTLEENETLIIALFLPIISCRNWRGPWMIKGSEWAPGKAGSVHTSFKRGWDSQSPFLTKGKIRAVLEGASQRSGDILRKFMHRERAVPSM